MFMYGILYIATFMVAQNQLKDLREDVHVVIKLSDYRPARVTWLSTRVARRFLLLFQAGFTKVSILKIASVFNIFNPNMTITVTCKSILPVVSSKRT